jgi:hypothetical protein
MGARDCTQPSVAQLAGGGGGQSGVCDSRSRAQQLMHQGGQQQTISCSSVRLGHHALHSAPCSRRAAPFFPLSSLADEWRDTFGERSGPNREVQSVVAVLSRQQAHWRVESGQTIILEDVPPAHSIALRGSSRGAGVSLQAGHTWQPVPCCDNFGWRLEGFGVEQLRHVSSRG